MDRRKLCRHMRPVMRRAHFYRSLPVGPTSGNGRWMAYPSQHFGCAFMSTRPSFYTLRPLRLIPCTAFSAEDPRLMDGPRCNWFQSGTPGGGSTTRGWSAWSATCKGAEGMGQPVGQRI
jgi:hypothetical protein